MIPLIVVTTVGVVPVLGEYSFSKYRKMSRGGYRLGRPRSPTTVTFISDRPPTMISPTVRPTTSWALVLTIGVPSSSTHIPASPPDTNVVRSPLTELDPTG